MNIEKFVEDRNKAFASGDEKKVRAYCKKYKIDMPKDKMTFLEGMHKAICNLYLSEDSPITLEQYNKSYEWLVEHGSSPSINEGGE